MNRLEEIARLRAALVLLDELLGDHHFPEHWQWTPGAELLDVDGCVECRTAPCAHLAPFLKRGAVLGELAVIQQRLAIMAGPKAMRCVLSGKKEAPRG